MSKLSHRKNMVVGSKYGVKCPYEMDPQYITVHNTANDASAWNEISYMVGNGNEVSYHYAVDDVEVVQGIPTNRNAWHSGDGANGTGNRKSIAVEICYSKTGGDRFTKAEKNSAILVAELLKQYGWGIDRVKTHQDWSKKNCPHRTMNMGWQRYLNMVQAELNALNAPPKPTGKTFYRVVCGSYTDRANADKRLSELKAKGFESFIDVYRK